MNLKEFQNRGGWWVVAQNALMVLAIACGPLTGVHPAWGLRAVLGITLLVLGAWVGVAGIRALGRNLTPFPKPHATSELVTRGAYAVVRHPLYCCLILLGTGWSVFWNSTAAWIATMLMTLVLDAKASREETWLQERYPNYHEYASRVGKLVPWIY